MLLLGPRLKITCIVLQVIPGVGAIVAGAKNPQSRYLGRGIAQFCLVLFGSWPLIIPGAVGVIWAWTDAYRIGRDAMPPGPMSRPTPDTQQQSFRTAPEQQPRGAGLRTRPSTRIDPIPPRGVLPARSSQPFRWSDGCAGITHASYSSGASCWWHCSPRRHARGEPARFILRRLSRRRRSCPLKPSVRGTQSSFAQHAKD